jgi:hypothetical protein
VANIQWIAADESSNDEEKQLANDARLRRNAMLAETDWIIIRAIETGEGVAEDVKTYRQQLRDIPQQSGFPSNIQWPEQPA